MTGSRSVHRDGPRDATPSLPVRVRFAPSPTGALHLGNVRAALFNYLFARHHGGAFILRLDDTDQGRDVASAADGIPRDLRRLGLAWDEGPDCGGPHAPYVQSERKPLYTAHLARLLESGHAYRCYCSTERLAALKAGQRARHEPPRYDRRCLTLTARERRALAEVPFTVRLRLPSATIAFDDLVYGPQRHDLRHDEDPILTRSDGSILYDLASVVDDHLMGITHILRGDGWLSTTPIHIAMFRALGWQPPHFAHLPQIVGPNRKKLGKRSGALSLRALLDTGYLPEALVNFLALMGWSPGDDTTLLTMDNLIEQFDLDHVQRSPALFDPTRLDWLNGQHIRRLAPADLAQRCLPALHTAGLLDSATPGVPDPHLVQVVALIQDRLRTLNEAPDLASFFFRESAMDRDLLLEKGPDAPEAADLLDACAAALEATSFAADTLEAALRALAALRGCATGQLFWLVRVAATGRRAAPPLFDVLAALGRATTLARMRQAANALRARGEPPRGKRNAPRGRAAAREIR